MSARIKQPQLVYWMDNNPVEHFMVYFAAWAYTRKIFKNSPWHIELWRFGQIIGSPSFMNAILQDLRAHLSSPKKDHAKHQPIITADHLKSCWDESNFMRDDKDAVLMDVKWENKKMLKFLIDVYAHRALHEKDFKNDAGLKTLLTGRDQLALQIARAIGAREKFKEAPWHEDCIGEYLVNEDMSESRFESDCRWEKD